MSPFGQSDRIDIKAAHWLVRAKGPRSAVAAVLIGLSFQTQLSVAAAGRRTVAIQSRPGPRRATLNVTEVSLGRFTPPGIVADSRVISPDGAHVACTVSRDGHKFVVLDGREQKAYLDIPQDPLTEAGRRTQLKFSPDGARLAYVAERDKDSFVVVVDGVEGKAYDDITVGAPVFSPDSRRVAYIARRNGKECVVVDGLEGKFYDYVTSTPISFSADSKHLAYPARQGGKRIIAVIDGVETAEADVIGFIQYSNNGAHYAYSVLRRGVERFAIDGVEGAEYFRVSNLVKFSEDGNHTAYLASMPDGDFLVVDGTETQKRGTIRWIDWGLSPDGRGVYILQGRRFEYYMEIGGVELGPYDQVTNLPEFSKDGKRYAFVTERGHKCSVVIDGAASPYYDDVDQLSFSPDGRRVCYVVSNAGKQYLVLDGVSSTFDKVGEVVFSPDGRRVAVTSRTGGKWHIRVDDAVVKSSEQPFSHLTFSPDGKRLAYIAKRGGAVVAAVDGGEGKPYARIEDASFSPDSKSFAYVATSPKVRIVLNGIESEPYDSLLSPPAFDETGALHFLALRSGEVFRATAR